MFTTTAAATSCRHGLKALSLAVSQLLCVYVCVFVFLSKSLTCYYVHHHHHRHCHVFVH